MKKAWLALIFLALVSFILPAGAEQGEEPDEWTVLVYMCGSDGQITR